MKHTDSLRTERDKASTPLIPRQTLWTFILLTSLFAWRGLADNMADMDAPRSIVDLTLFFEKYHLATPLQGQRGTCSVFTLTEALEYALAVKQGTGIRLSAEYLNWASNQVKKENRDGGFFSDLWKGYQVHGICTEQAMPYDATFDPNLMPDESVTQQAEQLLKNSPLRIHWIKKWNPRTGLADKELAVIKCVLSRNWPVCGGFRWPKEVRWKDGILNIPTPEGVYDGHSVLLVGYRDDPEQPGGGLFLYRNSITGRAEWMPYKYAERYMNDAVWIDSANER